MIGDELIGAVFVNAVELRHLAEQEFGALFVPTEVVASSERQATFALQVPGVGRLAVHARREREWHPFHITAVERPRLARTWVPSVSWSGSRPRANAS
jgi:hypothetical protein